MVAVAVAAQDLVSLFPYRRKPRYAAVLVRVQHDPIALRFDREAGMTQPSDFHKWRPSVFLDHPGVKVESQQQLYQPDQTALSGNFAQLQAVAESLVSRLQTVSLSDETTKKIQELALRDAKNSAGAQAGGEADAANTSANG